jgi:hypothetical protein
MLNRGMLTDLLKSQMFNVIFSFALGIGVIAILRPTCKGDQCNQTKAPPIKDWDGFVYRMGAKCYEYTSKIVECPVDKGSKELIESFQGEFGQRKSRLACD